MGGRATGVLDVAGLQALLGTLVSDGFKLIGPTVRDGAVTLAEIHSIDDLPRDIADDQAPGRYRLERTTSSFFGFAATAGTWKNYLLPSRRRLWRFTSDGTPSSEEPDATPRAFIGVRSCDLHAIGVLDTVLAKRTYVDSDYVSRRANTFIVAVTCARPSATCFCASMSTGPSPTGGYDLSLTELTDAGDHRFVVTSGSDAGAALLDRLPTRPVTTDDERAVVEVVEVSVAGMQRSVNTDGIRDLLYENAEHPQWDDVAARCLSCTNCTLVCPTCFCVTTEDVLDLTTPIGRDQVWDSCFNPAHSHLHGGAVRNSTRARYRQWVTHKFASWIDQFGSSGCVGCGRCITWCPAGIDVTAELAAIRSTAESIGGE